MSYINLALVFLYLVITLIIGILTGRKIKNLEEYTIGKRDFNAVILSMTVCATLIGGGSSLGTATEVFKYGIIVMLAKNGVSIGSLIIAFFIIPRMKKFHGMISVGEIVGSMYGNKARIITGICGALLCLCRMASQVMALGFVFNIALGVSNEIGVLLGAVIIIIYSSYGGIRSVAYTDVLQFVALSVTVPIVLNVALTKIGGYVNLFHILPEEKINIFYDKQILLKYLVVFLYMSLPLLSPPFVQRILMAKDLQDAQKSFITIACVDFVFTTTAGLIGLVAYVLYPDLSPNIAYLSLIDNILPEGLKGLALIGIMSVIMSTADSYLNMVGVSIVHDVIKPLNIKLSSKIELNFARILTCIAGISGTFIALYFDNIFELALYTTNFWGPIVVAPLLMGIFGFRTTNLSFIIGAFCGFGIFLLWEYFSLMQKTFIYSVVPAIAANVLGFFLSHYLLKQEGGWEKQNNTKDTLLSNRDRFSINFQIFQNYLNDHINFVPIPYNFFSIFLIISYVFPSIVWHESQSQDIIYIKSFVGFLAVLMLLRDIFGNIYKRHEATIWFMTLVLSLPFMSMITLYDSSLSSGGLIIFTLSILLLSFLVTSQMFILVLSTGVLTSIPYLYFSDKSVDYNISDIAWIVYVLAFTISIALLFIRNREENENKKVMSAHAIAGVIAHELKNPLSELDVRLYKFSKDISKQGSLLLEKKLENITQVSVNLKQTLDIIILKLKGGNISNLKIEKSEVNGFILNCIERYKKFSYVSDHKIQIICKNNSTMFCDKELMVHIIFNLLNNALYYNEGSSPVEVVIDCKNNMTLIIVRNYGLGISGDKINLIFNSFFTDRKNGTGLGLYFCKQAMLKMNGKITCSSIEGKSTDFMILMPMYNENGDLG